MRYHQKVDELYSLYLLSDAIGQKHIYFIASSIKIINKHNVLPCTDSNQPGWFHVDTLYVYSWNVICRDSCFYNRYETLMMIDWYSRSLLPCTDSHFMLEQIDLRTYFSTCNLPIQLLLCVNIIVNKQRLTTSIIEY